MFADFCRSLPFDYVWIQDLEGCYSYRSEGLESLGTCTPETADELDMARLKALAADGTYSCHLKVQFQQQKDNKQSTMSWDASFFTIRSEDGRGIVGVGGFVKHSSLILDDAPEVKKMKEISDPPPKGVAPEVEISTIDSETQEEESIATEEHLRDIIDASCTRKVLLDATGIILDCNRTFAGLFDVPQNELPGKRLFDLHPLQQQDETTSNCSEQQQEAVAQVLETSEEVTYETSVKNTHWECRVYPTRRSSNGTVLTLVLEERDVTQRKIAQLELQELKAHRMGLSQHMPCGYAYCQLVTDPETGKGVDYVFLEVNEHFEELVGAGCKGKRVTEALPGIENDEKDYMGIVSRVVHEGFIDRFSHYSACLGKWYTGITYKHIDDKFVTLFLDNTEQVAMQEKVRESEERHRNLFENMQQGVSYLSDVMQLVDCNVSICFGGTSYFG